MDGYKSHRSKEFVVSGSDLGIYVRQSAQVPRGDEGQGYGVDEWSLDF
jgi:hypothetical protein